MAVLRTIEQPAQFQYMIFCPGCKCGHGLRVGQPDGPSWTFNGSMEKPSFMPSLLINSARGVCHSFITNGQIMFLSDCTHELAGKTVPLEDF